MTATDCPEAASLEATNGPAWPVPITIASNLIDIVSRLRGSMVCHGGLYRGSFRGARCAVRGPGGRNSGRSGALLLKHLAQEGGDCHRRSGVAERVIGHARCPGAVSVFVGEAVLRAAVD